MFLTVVHKTVKTVVKKILTAVVIVKTPALTNLSLFISSQAVIATQALSFSVVVLASSRDSVVVVSLGGKRSLS